MTTRQTTDGPDMVSCIMDYESGQLDVRGTLQLFAQLIRTGHAWTLQGHYGRTATAIMDRGLIDDDGSITDDGWSVIHDTEDN